MSLVEVLLLIIALLLAVIAFDTLPQRVKSALTLPKWFRAGIATSARYSTVIAFICGGIWFLVFVTGKLTQG